jgi:hypothetical protein
MRVTRIVAGSMLVLLSATLAAIPAPVDVENVPLERVIANLERQVSERPTDAGLRLNLARVHAMAYAEKVTTIPSATVRGGSITIVPYLGLIPEFRPFEVKPSTDPKVTAIAREPGPGFGRQPPGWCSTSAVADRSRLGCSSSAA